MDATPKYTPKELDGWFDDPHWAARFPPLLTPAQAAELLGVPLQTVYDWSSRGLLDGCKARVGRRLRLARQRLLSTFLNRKKNP